MPVSSRAPKKESSKLQSNVSGGRSGPLRFRCKCHGVFTDLRFQASFRVRTPCGLPGTGLGGLGWIDLAWQRTSDMIGLGIAGSRKSPCHTESHILLDPRCSETPRPRPSCLADMASSCDGVREATAFRGVIASDIRGRAKSLTHHLCCTGFDSVSTNSSLTVQQLRQVSLHR